MELAQFDYDIGYRPGKDNHAADALSRAYCATSTASTLQQLHEALCHPGVARLHHYIKQKNLPYSMDDVKAVCSHCRVCAEQKPKFFKPESTALIKATKPMERLSVAFKGPLESENDN